VVKMIYSAIRSVLVIGVALLVCGGVRAFAGFEPYIPPSEGEWRVTEHVFGLSLSLSNSHEITTTLAFDGDMAYAFAQEQCRIGPRPSGSEENRVLGDYVIERLREYGWEAVEQKFVYGGVPIRNIIGKKGLGPIVIVGAHYDTRPIADKDPENPQQPIVGANDGASGVAVLLEIARVLNVPEQGLQVWLAFFDAEDRGNIDGWPFSVGAEYMAASLQERPRYMVLLDMVGDVQQEIYWETHSDPDLLKELWDIAEELGYGEQFIPEFRWGLTDDHIPFLRRGIPAVDIIDFDYPYWHTTQDTCDKIGAASLERVGRVVEKWLLSLNVDE